MIDLRVKRSSSADNPQRLSDSQLYNNSKQNKFPHIDPKHNNMRHLVQSQVMQNNENNSQEQINYRSPKKNLNKALPKDFYGQSKALETKVNFLNLKKTENSENEDNKYKYPPKQKKNSIVIKNKSSLQNSLVFNDKQKSLADQIHQCSADNIHSQETPQFEKSNSSKQIRNLAHIVQQDKFTEKATYDKLTEHSMLYNKANIIPKSKSYKYISNRKNISQQDIRSSNSIIQQRMIPAPTSINKVKITKQKKEEEVNLFDDSIKFDFDINKQDFTLKYEEKQEVIKQNFQEPKLKFIEPIQDSLKQNEKHMNSISNIANITENFSFCTTEENSSTMKSLIDSNQSTQSGAKNKIPIPKIKSQTQIKKFEIRHKATEKIWSQDQNIDMFKFSFGGKDKFKELQTINHQQ